MRALVVVVVSCCLATAARADDDVERARAHFRAGEAFFVAGLYDRAVEEYRAAYQLAPRPQLSFNIGSAYRKKAESTHARRDLEAAIAHYRRYLEGEPQGKGAESARVYIEALEAEARTLPPDPEPSEPEAAPPPAAAPPVVALPEVAVARRADRRWRTAGLVTAGTGVALVGAGVGFALAARSASDDLQGLADGEAWDMARYDGGRRAQAISRLAFATGAAALVAGGLFYLVLGRPRDVAIAPALGGGTVGVSFGGAFD